MSEFDFWSWSAKRKVKTGLLLPHLTFAISSSSEFVLKALS